jgi:hypothetical protein
VRKCNWKMWRMGEMNRAWAMTLRQARLSLPITTP